MLHAFSASIYNPNRIVETREVTSVFGKFQKSSFIVSTSLKRIRNQAFELLYFVR